jgi:predicted glycosyltransferase
MNILLFVNTPAQVHEFKYVARTLETRGHKIMILARDYECTLPLLDAYGLRYEVYGKAQKRGYKRALELIPYVRKAYQLAKTFKPDIIVGTGIIEAYTSILFRKPCIVFTDTETPSLEQFLFKPFVKAIYTPSCFRKDLGRKHIRYNGFKELAYLHPDYFQPDASIYNLLGIDSGERYVILRLNPLDAFHDIGVRGFSYEDKLRLIQALEPYACVFISSDAMLEPGLEKYAIGIPAHRIHDAEYYAQLLVTDAGTMLTEAAVLGTPGIHCSSYVAKQRLGNLVELDEKYQLIFSYSEPNQAIAKAVELIKQPDIKQQWEEKRRALLADKIDVLKFMVETIESYTATTNKLLSKKRGRSSS